MMHEDFIPLREFEELSELTRMSILKWAREYGFQLEEVKTKKITKYFIDKHLVTVFKEIKVIRREIQKNKIIAASIGRTWKVNNDNVTKYSAFKVGGLYEVFLNDKNSPIKIGYYKLEDIKNIKSISIF